MGHNDNLFPVAFFDPPQVLNAAVTPIPGSGSSPLQVIAQIVKSAYYIDYIDTTGDYIGVYKGAANQETLVCIIGGGLTFRASGVFAINSRISLRSMSASSITSGSLMCAFLGY